MKPHEGRVVAILVNVTLWALIVFADWAAFHAARSVTKPEPAVMETPTDSPGDTTDIGNLMPTKFPMDSFLRKSQQTLIPGGRLAKEGNVKPRLSIPGKTLAWALIGGGLLWAAGFLAYFSAVHFLRAVSR